MHSRWKKTLRWLLLGIATPLLLVVLFLVVERVRGKISLNRYERYLVAHGETLDPAAFKGPEITGSNGFPLLVKGAQSLNKGAALPDNYPPRMHVMPSGRAIVGFREPFWVQDKQTNRWEQVAADLAANEPTLAAVREALEMPLLANELDLSEGSKLRFVNLSDPKKLTQWFAPAAQLALREGRTHDATKDLVALIGLSRALEKDGVVISELVRIAISAVAKTAVWEALQAEGWSDDDLAKVQRAWEQQGFATNLVRAFQGELVFQQVCFNQMRKSHTETVGALFGLEDFLGVEEFGRPAWEQTVRSFPQGEKIAEYLKRQIYPRIWRFAWLDQDEQECMEQIAHLLANARTAAAGRSLAEVAPALERAVVRKRNLYDQLRFPEPQPRSSLSRAINRALIAEADRAVTLCAIALKRYSLKNEDFPESLNQLVPALLPALPVDYMDGHPIRYRRIGANEFDLYSVGENGLDEGGDATLLPGKITGRVLWNRRDFIWPKPARPEEVQEFRAEAAKTAGSLAATGIKPMTVNVLVINFDPVLHTRTNLKLHEYFKWSDPWKLTDKMVEDARVTSHGFVNYRVVEKIEHDGFTQFRNGFKYTEGSFLEVWEKDRNKADKSMTSFAWLFKEFDLARKIREQDISEIWLWGAPYMAWDELHWKTPGDKIPYQTENPWFYRPYDIPDVGRTIWIMGWNYERGEGEMLESYCHRIESVLSLTVGKGVWDPKAVTNNAWNQFSRVDKDWPGEAEVGTVHYAPNSKSDYDWNNTNLVWTFADDWLSYPKLPREKKLLNAQTGDWAGITGHHLWWMTRIPHTEGSTDGFFNNWWEYIVNYDDAIKRLPPPGASFERARNAMYSGGE